MVEKNGINEMVAGLNLDGLRLEELALLQVKVDGGKEVSLRNNLDQLGPKALRALRSSKEASASSKSLSGCKKIYSIVNENEYNGDKEEFFDMVVNDGSKVEDSDMKVVEEISSHDQRLGTNF